MSSNYLDTLKVKQLAHEYAISKDPTKGEIYSVAYNGYWAGMSYWEAQIIHWQAVYDSREISTPVAETAPESAYDAL